MGHAIAGFRASGQESGQGRNERPQHGQPALAALLVPACRCLVPLTSFSEPGLNPDGTSEPVRFALSDDRPLAFFAGIWTHWTSTRKVAEGPVACDLFAFLTTKDVRAVLCRSG